MLVISLIPYIIIDKYNIARTWAGQCNIDIGIIFGHYAEQGARDNMEDRYFTRVHLYDLIIITPTLMLTS